MVARIAVCAALMLAVSFTLPSPVEAACRDDLPAMKAHIDHEKVVDKDRYFAALKWWGRAQEVAPADEVECLNYLARAQKALSEPIPGAAGCNGPDAYQPACAGGAGGYGGPEPAMALGAGGFVAGGGGNTPAPQRQAVQPVAPVTANPPPAFNPPGSVGGPATSGR